MQNNFQHEIVTKPLEYEHWKLLCKKQNKFTMVNISELTIKYWQIICVFFQLQLVFKLSPL